MVVYVIKCHLRKVRRSACSSSGFTSFCFYPRTSGCLTACVFGYGKLDINVLVLIDGFWMNLRLVIWVNYGKNVGYSFCLVIE